MKRICQNNEYFLSTPQNWLWKESLNHTHTTNVYLQGQLACKNKFSYTLSLQANLMWNYKLKADFTSQLDMKLQVECWLEMVYLKMCIWLSNIFPIFLKWFHARREWMQGSHVSKAYMIRLGLFRVCNYLDLALLSKDKCRKCKLLMRSFSLDMWVNDNTATYGTGTKWSS